MNLFRRPWGPALLCAIVVTRTSSAWAGPDAVGGGSGSANKEADTRYEEGVRFLKKGKFEEARVKLTQSFALDPLPNVALSLAIAEEGLGRHADALRHVKAFLAHPSADPKRVAEVQSTLYRDLWAKTGHLRILADAGVDVTVDAEAPLRAPIRGTVDVMPGDHKVFAGTRAVGVFVVAGETKDVQIADTSSSAAPLHGSTPTPASPPGTVGAPPNQTDSERAPVAKYIVAGSLGLIGLVGIGTGVVLSIQGQDARSEGDALFAKPSACDLTPTLAACTKAGELASRVNDKATVSTVFYVGGAVFLLGSAATLVMWPNKKTNAAATHVRVAPGLGSLHLTGTF